MSRPYFSVKHVETLANLPAKLTPGRAYFVDDEQYIIIDHGNGLPPVIYGGKPGPQGASGEPDGKLQEQIDSLASSELQTQQFLWSEGVFYRNTISRIQSSLKEQIDLLRDLSDNNANAILSVIKTLQEKFNDYDNAIATLSKTVANLYPESFNPAPDIDNPTDGITTLDKLAQVLNVGDGVQVNGENLRVKAYSINDDGSISVDLESEGAFSAKNDPLDNETLDTTIGKFTIQQTVLADGTIILDLTGQDILANKIYNGVTVRFNGEDYTVSNYSRNSDGSVSFLLS